MNVLTEALQIFTPPPNLTVSQWADEKRVLSPESSSEPGQWRTERAEYLRGMMDAVTDPEIITVTIMKSAQVGATEIINNIIGYHIDQDPAPMLLIFPSDRLGEKWSKDRFAPMVRDTHALKNKVAEIKSRDSSNTILHKTFKGGNLTIVGANNPGQMASMPKRIVLADEADRITQNSGKEGNALDLGAKRTSNFWNKKLIYVSTPTLKEFSQIETLYMQGDQRRYFVPCLACGKMQELKWAQVKWQRDPETDKHLPATAYYECPECEHHWTEAERITSIRLGEWRATEKNPIDPRAASFYIWEIYSPWSSLERIVSEFLKAKNIPEKLQVWVNTCLGESWEEEGTKADDLSLYNRREVYPADIPANGLVLTCGVDIQLDWIVGEVVAWGDGEESWNVDYFILHGDPEKPQIWTDLDQQLQKVYQHENGLALAIKATCIDSGYKTDHVYKFVRPRELRGIYAVKGYEYPGKPLVGKPSKSNKAGVKLFSLSTDSGKEMLMSRMHIEETGPGYMHFPTTRDNDYFRGLTAEKAVTEIRRGVPRRYWRKIRERNEPVDCRIYATAALHILNPNYKAVAASLDRAVKASHVEDRQVEKHRTATKKRRKKPGWVNGY
jgi:phage terminase large subunit GpA-like protein